MADYFRNITRASILYKTLDEIRVQLIRDIYEKYGSISKFKKRSGIQLHPRTIQRLSTLPNLSLGTIEEVAKKLGYKLSFTLEKNG